jgi:hypothetical protein
MPFTSTSPFYISAITSTGPPFNLHEQIAFTPNGKKFFINFGLLGLKCSSIDSRY